MAVGLQGKRLHTALSKSEETGDFGAAASWWRKLVEIDPLATRATLGLMTALASAGDTGAALVAGAQHQALLESELGARRARPLYCSCDPAAYFPEERSTRWDLGYMGTYSTDRQGPLEALLFRSAVFAPNLRFVVAGALYPTELAWPRNVERIEHLPPADHRAFYGAQRFTLNLTRADMRAAGYSPSVRLFEAAACGAPILSDDWPGLDELFRPGEEILIVRSSRDVVRALERLSPDEARRIGRRAWLRVRAEHSAAQRAELLERYLAQALAGRAGGVGRRGAAAGPTAPRVSVR